MNKEIPISIQKIAQSLIRHYGQNIIYLGEFRGVEYYTFQFPERTITGYPVVYMYNITSKEARKILGSRALDIICELTNN